jgi:UMF1 family MFS transporter
VTEVTRRALPSDDAATGSPPVNAVAARIEGALATGARKRELWAWAMYDFANSGYTTVVITAVFNAYFVATIAGDAPWATFAWTSALALSYALIVLTAPLLGALADLRAMKKRLLLATTLGCVLGTAALSLTGPGTLWLAVALVVFSNFCYGSGENLSAAFLPELARPDALGRVSGWGWALGYLGGLLALGLSIAWVGHVQARGGGAQDFVPGTMLITAALFALAALPTFLLLRERAVPQAARATHLARESFARLRHTLANAARYRDLARLLACITCYQAGVQTVIALAAVYATQALGFGAQQTLVMLLVVNVTAALGALAFGTVQDRLGHRRTLALTLWLWIATIGVAWAARDEATFWVAANLAGLAMGAAQSAGRALVGWLSPEARRAEFFGLWGLAVKLASILGPMTYGAITWAAGGEHRPAMLATGLFFVAGLWVLRGVDVARGRAAALAPDP